MLSIVQKAEVVRRQKVMDATSTVHLLLALDHLTIFAVLATCKQLLFLQHDGKFAMGIGCAEDGHKIDIINIVILTTFYNCHLCVTIRTGYTNFPIFSDIICH